MKSKFRIKNLPIRHKLVLAILPGILVLVFLFGLAILHEKSDSLEALGDEVGTIAEMLAWNCKAAVHFDDRDETRKLLESTRAYDHVVGGYVFDIEGELFAEFIIDEESSTHPIPELRPHGFYDAADGMRFYHDIFMEDEKIGSVLVWSTTDGINSEFRSHVYIGSLIALAASLLIIFMTVRAQRWVSQPILSLSETARSVSKIKDYSLRAKTDTEDELGELVTNFNQMLMEIQQRDEALRDSEERYRLLFEFNPHPMWVYDLETLEILAVNDTAIGRYGYSRDEFRSMTVNELLLSEDMPAGRAEAVKTTTGVRFIGNQRHRKKDGSVVFVEIVSYGLNFAGRRAEIVIAVDITDRLKAEQEKARLAEAVEQAAEIIMITDVNGEIQYVNSAFEQVTGYSREEAIGNNPRFLKSGIQTGDFYNDLWRTLLDGKVWAGQFVNRKKDGSVYTEQGAISPLRDASGSIVSFVAVKRDVSKEVDLENLLQQAQKMEAIGTLAGGIAHDFNNILNAVIGYTELAMGRMKPEDEIYNNLQEVLKAGGRATDLVRQILTFSRQKVQEPKPMEIQAVMKEALKLLRGSLPTTIEIHDSVNSDCGVVVADPTEIHQVIMNLCTNAYHAMRETGGVLKVSLEQIEYSRHNVPKYLDLAPGKFARISVGDTGHGMDDETRHRIFEPYFTTKRGGEGTGLGLATVHGIVKGYSGDISVNSEIGQGSTFNVYLPISMVDMDMRVRTETMTPLPRGDERVLLVDDEKTITNVGKNLLERLGYRVEGFTNSVQALDRFRLSPSAFDLVITDQTMPNLTGVDLSRELLQMRPDLPVILCTGFSEIVDEKRALDMGIRAYIMKPIVARKLAETVRHCLDNNGKDIIQHANRQE